MMYNYVRCKDNNIYTLHIKIIYYILSCGPTTNLMVEPASMPHELVITWHLAINHVLASTKWFLSIKIMHPHRSVQRQKLEEKYYSKNQK